ncbi:MAG TPA: hypothetical protein VFC47_11275 [Caulobacteraceae bacterium]|nr:hypothetical protein [Caulobacteraceae bacterium]
MQAVGSLFSSGGFGGGGGASPDGAPTGSDFNMADNTGGFGLANSLGLLRAGTSAISALSAFTMSSAQAQSLDMEAADENIAARGDYIQAQQKSNAINTAYNQVVGQQLAVASAGGVDVGSGSVQEAGRQARTKADQAITVAQTDAQTDASLRQARAGVLQASASITRTTGILSGISDIAKGALNFAQIGAPLPGGD